MGATNKPGPADEIEDFVRRFAKEHPSLGRVRIKGIDCGDEIGAIDITIRKRTKTPASRRRT